MNVIRARNPHHALHAAVSVLYEYGVEQDSRNGPVLVLDSPMTTVYERPMERVVFWPQRDGNPFFHFFESLWMLGGRNDIGFLTRFVPSMKDFSDDGVTHHGAYGRRWRVGMPAAVATMQSFRPVETRDYHDQLALVVRQLRDNPHDRRCVVQMWDARSDLGHGGKDVPCNLIATFQRCPATGRLNMVVFNRSNDIVWGCYGANAVHFSFLLEYVALCAGMVPGTYTQISVNWHGYRKTFDPLYERFKDDHELYQPYEYEGVKPYPLMQESAAVWDQDLKRLLSAHGRAPVAVFRDPFFENVAVPLLRAHDAYKDTQGEARYDAALRHLNLCHASDWRLAAREWISRRWARYRRDADDGPTGY